MRYRIQDSDAFILREFSREADPYRKKNWKPGTTGADNARAMIPIVTRYAERLRRNGHDEQTISDLLKATFLEEVS